MASVDPAWFYSSLAQAAAAIVGLFGAVFGARLIDHLQVMRARRRDVMNTLRDVQQAVMPTRRRTTEYEAFLSAELIETRNALKRGEQQRTYVQRMGWGFTQGDRSVTMATPALEERLRFEHGVTHDVLFAYPRFTGVVEDLSARLSLMEDLLSRLEPHHLVVATVRNDLDWLRRLAPELGAFRADLLPAPFLLVFGLLTLLSAGCILWPLAALPGYSVAGMQQSFPKEAMWHLFAVGLIGLFGYMGYLLKELRDLGRIHWLK